MACVRPSIRKNPARNPLRPLRFYALECAPASVRLSFSESLNVSHLYHSHKGLILVKGAGERVICARVAGRTVIKAVLLDLGNVIVPVDFTRCHAAFSEVCSFLPQEIPAKLRPAGLVERFETGRITPEEFVNEVCGILGMRVSTPQFWEIWSRIFLPQTLLPESLVEGLRRRQRLLLLSNTNAIHFAMVKERYPLLRHFDDFVLSFEVGATKPSPAIYREAIARAGCRPEECFYADDIGKFVEAARQEGIDAVQFHSREQLEAELVARGITW